VVHFFLGLPILLGFLIYFRHPLNVTDLVWFPVVVFTQLLLTVGLSFIVSALTVHFRDLKDLLANLITLWFFATPIIYPMTLAAGVGKGLSKRVLDLNPFTHLAISYQEILFYDGPFGHWKWLLALLVVSAGLFVAGYALFDRLRDSFAEGV
jgi:lipopolysaccharide transport system permease protein